MNQDDAARGWKWYRQHEAHVHKLAKEEISHFGSNAYEPTGSDATRPELWRAPHWRWFLENHYRLGFGL